VTGRRHHAARCRAGLRVAAPTERDLDEAMDVGLLRVDLLAEFGDDATQFRDHGLGVGQPLAEHVDVVGIPD